MSEELPVLLETHHLLRGHDGCPLDVLELNHPSVGTPSGWNLSVTVLLGHCLFADRRTLYKPGKTCMAYTLASFGFRVILPNLRGRGKSGLHPSQGGFWTYDDLVLDIGSLLDFCTSSFANSRTVIVGHSLFGHASLAFLSSHPQYYEHASFLERSVSSATRGIQIDSHLTIHSSAYAGKFAHEKFNGKVVGCVTIASNSMPYRIERDWYMWFRKSLTILFGFLVSLVLGYVPARKLGMGTCDESYGFFRALVGFILWNGWRPLPHLRPAAFAKEPSRHGSDQNLKKHEDRDVQQCRGTDATAALDARPAKPRTNFCPGKTGFDAGLSKMALPSLCCSSLGDVMEGIADCNMLFSSPLPHVDYLVLTGNIREKEAASNQLRYSVSSLFAEWEAHARKRIPKIFYIPNGSSLTDRSAAESTDQLNSTNRKKPSKLVKSAPSHVGLVTDWRKSAASWGVIASWIRQLADQ
eukprot:ANDGO_00024.mRNA.1 hypothetical protein